MKIEICPDCEGVGEIYLGKNYVTLEMAIDAGDRSMAGQFYGHRYAPCDTCGGTGEIKVSDEVE